MNTILKALAAVSAVSAMGLGASAAHAADATATATAEILEAVAIVNVGGTALDFGAIVPDAASSGSVVVAASTATTPSACNTVSCFGTVSAAPFQVTGSDGKTVDVSVPASVTLTRSGGTETMTASLSDSLGGTSTTLSGGSANFFVGGTLTVGAAQTAGVYNGTFTVSADYQ